MRDMLAKTDLSVLDEIIKLAEQAMAKGVGKKKPDMAVMEVSLGKGPGFMARKGREMMSEDGMESEMEDEEVDPESKMEISEGGTSVEVEPEDGNELSDADIQDLIEAYKSKKG
jgi:hypothetical protein